MGSNCVNPIPAKSKNVCKSKSFWQPKQSFSLKLHISFNKEPHQLGFELTILEYRGNFDGTLEYVITFQNENCLVRYLKRE